MRPLITVTADAFVRTSRGRLLVLGWAAAFAFACVQRVAAMRVIAEMRPTRWRGKQSQAWAG